MFQQNAWTPPVQNPPRGGRGWIHVLLTGIVLFVAATVVMFLTNNPNLYPTVILIGNFLVPVVFVTFLYDHQHLSALTPEKIAKSFFLVPPGFHISLVTLALSVIGIVVFVLLYRRATVQTLPPPTPVNP